MAILWLLSLLLWQTTLDTHASLSPLSVVYIPAQALPFDLLVLILFLLKFFIFLIWTVVVVAVVRRTTIVATWAGEILAFMALFHLGSELNFSWNILVISWELNIRSTFITTFIFWHYWRIIFVQINIFQDFKRLTYQDLVAETGPTHYTMLVRSIFYGLLLW